jgi:hypothetical protein
MSKEGTLSSLIEELQFLKETIGDVKLTYSKIVAGENISVNFDKTEIKVIEEKIVHVIYKSEQIYIKLSQTRIDKLIELYSELVGENLKLVNRKHKLEEVKIKVVTVIPSDYVKRSEESKFYFDPKSNTDLWESIINSLLIFVFENPSDYKIVLSKSLNYHRYNTISYKIDDKIIYTAKTNLGIKAISSSDDKIDWTKQLNYYDVNWIDLLYELLFSMFDSVSSQPNTGIHKIILE